MYTTVLIDCIVNVHVCVNVHICLDFQSYNSFPLVSLHSAHCLFVAHPLPTSPRYEIDRIKTLSGYWLHVYRYILKMYFTKQSKILLIVVRSLILNYYCVIVPIMDSILILKYLEQYMNIKVQENALLKHCHVCFQTGTTLYPLFSCFYIISIILTKFVTLTLL